MAETARNPDALHEEIKRTRDELAHTIDTIADRVSPKNVARRSGDQLKANAASMRKKLPQGRGNDDSHTQLALRGGESSNPGRGVAGSMQATGEVVRSNRTVVLVGVGIGVLAVVVLTWRRVRR